MKKRYFKFIASIMVIMLFVLSTGCGVRINGKDYELFSVKDKDRNGILSGLGSEVTQNQELSGEILEAEQLNIKSSVGGIEIQKSGDSQITVKAVKKVKGSTEETKNNILDNMNIQFERDGKIINIVVKTKDDKNFWDWQTDNFKIYSPSIDYEITIPENINKVQVNTGVGDIDVGDVTSNLKLYTGVGEINVDNVAALGDTVLKTGTGDIGFEGNIDNLNSMDANTGVGEIDFRAPEGSKMSLKASTGVGELSGDFIKLTGDFKFKFEGDINGGGPSVILKTGVGDVKADSN